MILFINVFCNQYKPEKLFQMLNKNRTTAELTTVNFCDFLKIDCHRDVIASSGTIKSPVDSPVGYPRRYNCSWLITVDVDDIIALNITTLNIGNDVLTIYDGMSSSAQALNIFFRHSKNVYNNITMLSSTNNIYILLQYEMGSNLSESGFVLEYRSQQIPTGVYK